MNNIPKYQGGGYLARLMGANIGDIQSTAAKKLAESQRKAKKKEGKWRGFSNILKTVANVALPGFGGAVLGAVIDPIGRGVFKQGARASDIKLSKDYQIFGGKEGLETAKGGLQDELDRYKQQNITSSLAGFAGSKIGGAMLDKWGSGLKDALGFGGINPALQQQALNMQNIKGAGMGTQLIMDSLEEGVGSEWGGTGLREMYGYNPYLSSVAGSTSPGNYAQGGMVQKFVDGGMVQKYQDGGTTTAPRMIKTYKDKNIDGKLVRTAWYTPYTYDGLNWNEGTGSWQNPNYDTITQSQMDNWRSEARTKKVGSRYMETTSEVGLNEFLRTPAVANLVKKAREGDEYAMENLVEMLRQQRPEMADKTNEELRKALGKILPDIDLYGEDYQGTLAKGATALEGLTGKAKGARAQVASGAATSGIRTGGGGFKGGDTISEALYSGAEDVYSGMQRDIQTGFEEEFDPLATMFTSVT